MDKAICFLLVVVLGTTDLIQCINELSTCPQNYISSGSADDICEPCWKRFESKCYRMSQDTKRWIFAKNSCSMLGAKLVIIKSKEEQNFLRTLTNQNISWIGLSSPNKKNIWQWVDGSNVSLSFWKYDNPTISSGQKQTCVQITENGEWSTESCTESLQYVCEKDANECLKNNTCARNAECHNTIGSFSCYCKNGFQTQSGRVASISPQEICLDEDECSSSICPENAECHNTIGSYYCTCNSGFKRLSGAVNFTGQQEKCEDDDECGASNTCPSNAECHNTVGSYYCICKPGFKSLSGAVKFTGTHESCEDDNECWGNNTCQSNAECHNTIGSYYCTCKPGFMSLSGAVNFTDPKERCEDNDECIPSNTCPSNAKCQNTIGSYYCTCKPGFHSVSGAVNFTDQQETCEDDDECSINNTCPNNAECHNTNGSYYCTCEFGFKSLSGAVTFTGSQDRCEDDDECGANNTCPNNAKCHNTNGSYYCMCKPGFKSLSGAANFTDTQQTCIDDDECVFDNTCPSNAECHNTIGSHYCMCSLGYSSLSGAVNFTDTQERCKDNDECMADNICPINAQCHNTIGSYYCTCKPGYNSLSGRVNFTSLQDSCEGQPCHCCKELQNPNASQCPTSNLTLVNSQMKVDRIFTVGLNNGSAETQREEQQKEITSLLQEVEKSVLDDVLNALKSNGTQGETIFHNTEETVIVARSVPVNSSELNETLVITAGTTTMSIKAKTVIEGTEQGVLPVVVLISFHGYDIESILSGGAVNGKDMGNTIYEINSKIITATTSSKNKNGLSHPIMFTFLKNKTKENEIETSTCVFWKTDDKNRSYWSTDGCELSKRGNRTHVTCECNHLSTFAVLLAHTAINERPLNIISVVGLTFSVICLILSIMTFRLCHSIQNASTTLLLNLCICLLIADGIFLFGISQTTYKILCKVISAFLHYSLLASFSWMCLGALQLHRMVQNLKAVKAFRTHVIRRRYMYPVGYGAPAIIVVISAAVFPQGYGTDKICWLSLDRGFRWSFIGPVCFVILVNLILFTITIHILREKFSTLNKDVSTIKNTKMLLFKATAQFLVLGCTWIFGIFHFREETLVMSYLFTILNSFHGVFMFLLYCAANKLEDTHTLEWIKMKPKTEDQDNSKNL
ncbi:adhesion G protein-coupled receptor E2-like isoform X2 [Protopterus annectens]|uniref:adhesion G protein-coupled receptor E2-like isoform X2 n=1 Tax=Protopterus annectens TaxID=7888 RepID=UPI001CFBB40D|nr:adhesion G protein-coupled receptor E2-like isoform X2 [Protopterus annectens]